MSALIQTVKLIKPHNSGRLLSREASRYFVVWFAIVSAVLYGIGSFFLVTSAPAAFRVACYSGMGLCTVTSLVSFLLLELSMDKPMDVFLGVALGSVFVRLFSLIFAFAIGQFFLKMNVFGMATGMFTAYFSYLVVEISYFHKKQLIRGQ